MNIKPTRNNIIVKNPIKKMSTTIEITEEVQRQYAEEQLQNAQKAEVLAVGTACTEVKAGDVVRIKTSRFMSADPLEDDKYLVFSEADVIAIY